MSVDVCLCRFCGVDVSDGTTPFYVVKKLEDIWMYKTLLTTIESRETVTCEKCHIATTLANEAMETAKGIRHAG